MLEDSGIIELFFRRDEAAVASCREKYGAMLRHIAYGILCSREDSEECENDTYLRTWNHIPPEKPASLGAYLGRIVRNLALNYVEIFQTTLSMRQVSQTRLFVLISRFEGKSVSEYTHHCWQRGRHVSSLPREFFTRRNRGRAIHRVTMRWGKMEWLRRDMTRVCFF